MNINRKIAMSGMSIVSALVLLGGTAFAAFSDSATQTNNTFAVGSANLEIANDVSNSPGAYGESITGPSYSGLTPGDANSFTFWLKNNSTATVDLSLTADVSAINPAADGDQEVDNSLLISWVCDTELNGFEDNVPSGEFSPRAWLDGGNAGVGTLAPGQQAQCKMMSELPITADNTVAGETVAFDAVYDGAQASE